PSDRCASAVIKTMISTVSFFISFPQHPGGVNRLGGIRPVDPHQQRLSKLPRFLRGNDLRKAFLNRRLVFRLGRFRRTQSRNSDSPIELPKPSGGLNQRHKQFASLARSACTVQLRKRLESRCSRSRGFKRGL